MGGKDDYVRQIPSSETVRSNATGMLRFGVSELLLVVVLSAGSNTCEAVNCQEGVVPIVNCLLGFNRLCFGLSRLFFTSQNGIFPIITAFGWPYRHVTTQISQLIESPPVSDFGFWNAHPTIFQSSLTLTLVAITSLSLSRMMVGCVLSTLSTELSNVIS